MKRVLMLSVGIAAGDLIYQVAFHGYENLDFYKVVFIGVFSFLAIVAVEKMK
jgi:hypothetical protein